MNKSFLFFNIITENFIDDTGFVSLCEALKSNKTLSCVSLSRKQQWIVSKWYPFARECFHSNTIIREQNKSIFNSSTVWIINDKHKPFWTRSEWFTYSIHGLTTKCETNSIFFVNLFTENNIGDIGAESLSKSLKVNTSLTKLYLNSELIIDNDNEMFWTIIH